MVDTQIVFQVTLFLGIIGFAGASLGASNFIDMEGTEDIERIDDLEQQKFNVNDTLDRQEMVFDTRETDPGNNVSALYWTGNNTGELYYDVSGINELRFVTVSTYFFPGVEVFDNATDESLGVPRGDGSGLDVRTSQTFDLENVDTVRLDFTRTDRGLKNLRFVETERGFLDNLRFLTSLFDITTDTNWFFWMVVIPLGAVGLFLLIKYAGDYIPFT